MADDDDTRNLPAIISRADAKAAGLKRYFTGEPCKHGHIAERQVGDGKCVVCSSKHATEWGHKNLDKRRAWHAANKDKIKARRAEAYKENREKMLQRAHDYWVANQDRLRQRDKEKYWSDPEKYRAYARAWAAANPEKVKAYRAASVERHYDKLMKAWASYRAGNREKLRERTRAYQAANPEKVKASRAASYAKHKEKRRAEARDYCEEHREWSRAKSAEWRKNNPEKRKAYYHANFDKNRFYQENRRARKLGAEGFHTKEDVERIRKDQNGKCALCRVKLCGVYHIDHIVPLSKGGSNWPANLQLLCKPCNLSKGARDPIDHARTLGLLL